MGARRSISVGIIGAGFGGIVMAQRLLRAGFDDFTIFDSWDDFGGTWLHNTYPGAAVDTPSHMYSFSFRRHAWTSLYAPQAELLGYLQGTARELGLYEHTVFGTEIVSVRWDETAQRQRVTSRDGRSWSFDVVVSAMGILNVPSFPDWPGRQDYAGTVVHTSRWDHGVDWAGKRVAVVGTGSSAAQVIPALAPDSERVTVFMRQPVWVAPKFEHTFTPEERAHYAKPWRYRWERFKVFWAGEREWFGGRIYRPGSKADRRAVARCSTHMRNQIQDPALLQTLMPNGPYMAKRPVRSAAYLPALQRENVDLVPRAVTRYSRDGVIDSEGVEHPADIVVTATGFRPAEYLLGVEVVGRDGVELHERWGDEPEAFLGVDVPGFPNFFMLLGPNSTYYAVVYNQERQADFIVRVLRRMRRTGATAAELKPRYFERFNAWLRRRLADSSFARGVNYFKSATGKVVTQWPDGAILFWLLTRFLAIPSTSFRRAPAASAPAAAATE